MTLWYVWHVSFICVAWLVSIHALNVYVAVWCSVLQRVAACCSVLQRVAVCCSVLQCYVTCLHMRWMFVRSNGPVMNFKNMVAVCCSVLQCVAVRCCVLQCAAVCCSALLCVAVCCSVLRCVSRSVAECCSHWGKDHVIRRTKVSHMYESCHTYEWVMSHI